MPNITKLVHYSMHETLLFLGAPIEDNTMTMCLGVGLVKKIEKGEEFDVVGMDFGRGFTRDIIVKNNHARRQIYTLKKGQYGSFYGYMKYYTKDKKTTCCFYAKAFQGWYVPKSVDIIKIDPNEIDKLTQENESKINFIDDLLKGE